MTYDEEPSDAQVAGLTATQLGIVFVIFVAALMICCGCGWAVVAFA